MFDIGFWELTIIGVVALVVIGPERLPGVARTMGIWIGKARNFVSSVQADLKQEVNRSEELSKLLEEQSHLKDMHEIIEQTLDETKKTVSVGYDQFKSPVHEVKSLEDEFEESIGKEQIQAKEESSGQSDVQSPDAVNDNAK